MFQVRTLARILGWFKNNIPAGLSNAPISLDQEGVLSYGPFEYDVELLALRANLSAPCGAAGPTLWVFADGINPPEGNFGLWIPPGLQSGFVTIPAGARRTIPAGKRISIALSTPASWNTPELSISAELEILL